MARMDSGKLWTTSNSVLQVHNRSSRFNISRPEHDASRLSQKSQWNFIVCSSTYSSAAARFVVGDVCHLSHFTTFQASKAIPVQSKPPFALHHTSEFVVEKASSL